MDTGWEASQGGPPLRATNSEGGIGSDHSTQASYSWNKRIMEYTRAGVWSPHRNFWSCDGFDFIQTINLQNKQTLHSRICGINCFDTCVVVTRASSCLLFWRFLAKEESSSFFQLILSHVRPTLNFDFLPFGTCCEKTVLDSLCFHHSVFFCLSCLLRVHRGQNMRYFIGGHY